MTVTTIQYSRRIQPKNVYERASNEQEHIIKIVKETIEHFNYDDLWAKISTRFKELLNLHHTPLFDLKCNYLRLPTMTNFPEERLVTNHLTKRRYDRIDWTVQDEDAQFTAIYYTFQDSDGDSEDEDLESHFVKKSNSMHTIISAIESLHKRLCKLGV